MYQPKHFRIGDQARLHALIEDNALAMVPTWNYAVVHAHGRVAVLDDDALVSVLDDLSTAQEGRLDKTPWTTQKMDQELYVKMRGAIVGFQMPIQRLEGTFKMSQNRPDTARSDVITALDSIDADTHIKQPAQCAR